jgi:hypothetical protein
MTKIELRKRWKIRDLKTKSVRWYEVGEIADVRPNTALAWIKQKIAKPATNQEAALAMKRLPIVQGFDFVYDKQVFWDGQALLKDSRIEKGLAQLDTWQVVAPLYDTLLAIRCGDEEERRLTEQIIHDLRVPVYETGIIFMRKCEETINLLQLWRDELQRGDSPLAFMRALYVAQPMILALPSAWLNL